MNYYLVFYMDKILEETMDQFVKLLKHSIFHFDRNGFILVHSKKMIGFYEGFFKQIGFLPSGHNYYKRELLIEIDRHHNNIPKSDSLKKRLVSLMELKGLQFSMSKDNIFPVHIHSSTTTQIQLITGIAILEKGSTIVRFVLHELGIPKHLIKSTPQHLKYLNTVLEHYATGQQPSVKELLDLMDRNYNQFQKDCKVYYGDTFYQFYIKKKMIGAVGDIMFSELSLKEIAHQNDFLDYNNMYKIFTKHKVLPLIDIPRFSRDF